MSKDSDLFRIKGLEKYSPEDLLNLKPKKPKKPKNPTLSYRRFAQCARQQKHYRCEYNYKKNENER